MFNNSVECSNCKSILVPNFIYMDGKETYLGLYSCPSCHRIDISKEFVEEIYKKLFLKEFGINDENI